MIYLLKRYVSSSTPTESLHVITYNSRFSGQIMTNSFSSLLVILRKVFSSSYNVYLLFIILGEFIELGLPGGLLSSRNFVHILCLFLLRFLLFLLLLLRLFLCFHLVLAPYLPTGSAFVVIEAIFWFWRRCGMSFLP